MTRLAHRAARALAFAVAATLAVPAAHAEIIEILYTFDGELPGGMFPLGGVVMGDEGHLYGTTSAGGAGGGGTLWRRGGGDLHVMHEFAGGADGAAPAGPLTEHGGRLYGTTARGGPDDAGTLFLVRGPTGYQTLAAFPATMAHPSSGLGLGLDGVFYGTTVNGGGACDCGTVWRYDPVAGGIAMVHGFDGRDGAHPTSTPVPVGGFMTGTAAEGGDARRFPAGAGTLWQVATNGGGFLARTSRVGGQLASGLTYDRSGRAFGVARVGGPGGGGGIYEVLQDGSTRFRHTFVSAQSNGGANPSSPLLLGSDGLLYGTTETGGFWPCFCGTVFRFDPATDEITSLHAFDGIDGSTPTGTLAEDAAGRILGTASRGGYADGGTLWRLTYPTHRP